MFQYVCMFHVQIRKWQDRTSSLAHFDGVDEDFLVKPGDPYKPEWDEPRESDSHLVGHFVLHDKVEQVSGLGSFVHAINSTGYKVSKYEFAAPRKWSYKCSKSKIYEHGTAHLYSVPVRPADLDTSYALRCL